MTEKNGFAQILDAIAGGLSKMKDGAAEKKPAGNQSADLVNVLPKPVTQEIGDGFIRWRWRPDLAKVEAILATSAKNPYGLGNGNYAVNVQFPMHPECAYSMLEDVAKNVGQTILSAYNWQHIWKIHAGDFLLASMNLPQEVEFTKEPTEEKEILLVEDQPQVKVETEPGTEVATLPPPTYHGPNCDMTAEEYLLRNANG